MLYNESNIGGFNVAQKFDRRNKMSEETGKNVKDGLKKGASIVGKIIKWFFIIVAIIIVLVIGYSVYTCTAVTKAVVDATGGNEIIGSAVREAVREATGTQIAVETIINGETYTQIEPKKLAFDIDNGTVKKGERYVFDDTCFGVNGATLMLSDVGVMNQITLTEFADYPMGRKLRVYVVVDEVTPSIKIAKFKAIKIIEL
jgi:hypothetical protein